MSDVVKYVWAPTVFVGELPENGNLTFWWNKQDCKDICGGNPKPVRVITEDKFQELLRAAGFKSVTRRKTQLFLTRDKPQP
jgi:hypothetical protein